MNDFFSCISDGMKRFFKINASYSEKDKVVVCPPDVYASGILMLAIEALHSRKSDPKTLSSHEESLTIFEYKTLTIANMLRRDPQFTELDSKRNC